jgi:hypothetical protein
VTDFVVYHKPEVMGYQVIDVDKLAIYTNKTAANVVGHRVWLMTGEGKPRAYMLRAVFVADEVGISDKPAFKTRVSGKAGHLFHPMPQLDKQPWFVSFKKSQGNFAFGLAPITEPDAVDGLQRLLKAATV